MVSNMHFVNHCVISKLLVYKFKSHSTYVQFLITTFYGSLPILCLFLFTGESHFDAQRNPHLYFQVLLLTLQFEAVSNSHSFSANPQTNEIITRCVHLLHFLCVGIRVLV